MCRNGKTNPLLNHLSTCSLLSTLRDAVRPRGQGKNIHTLKLWVRIAGQVINNSVDSKYLTIKLDYDLVFKFSDQGTFTEVLEW